MSRDMIPRFLWLYGFGFVLGDIPDGGIDLFCHVCSQGRDEKIWENYRSILILDEMKLEVVACRGRCFDRGYSTLTLSCDRCLLPCFATMNPAGLPVFLFIGDNRTTIHTTCIFNFDI